MKELIAEVITETECDHTLCPWKDELMRSRLAHIRELPPGAWKMVKMTWAVLDSVGQLVGKAFSIGLFVLILGLIYLGGTVLLKLGMFMKGGQ